MESLDWSKQYIVFSVSRLDLLHQLGFSHDQISQLSDADMQILVEKVRENYEYLENDFSETVRFVIAVVLAEKEERMKPSEWLVKQFTDRQQAFLDWLASYIVDTASGLLPADTTRGFPAPDRKADAIYLDTGDEENPYHSPMQLEVWQENEVVLGILQITDNVVGQDVFTWYRVPVFDIPTGKE